MPEVFVSKIDDFADGDRRIVFHGGLEIGVFHWQGNYYAYENLCLHQGGPCCEGVIMHKVEDVQQLIAELYAAPPAIVQKTMDMLK